MQSRKDKLQLTINLASDADWSIYEKIKDALSSKPSVLELELIGLGHVQPDVTLAIYDLLINKDASISFEVDVKTSLYNGTILLVLIAQKAKIRSTSWFQLDSVKRLESTDWSEREDIFGLPQVRAISEPSGVTDYRAIAGLINEFLPVEELSDKRLPLQSTLKEFGLLQSETEELELQKLFSPDQNPF